MRLGLDFFRGEDLLYHSFFINDKGGAESSHILAAIHALLSPYAHLIDQQLVRIGNQRERQLMFLS